MRCAQNLAEDTLWAAVVALCAHPMKRKHHPSDGVKSVQGDAGPAGHVVSETHWLHFPMQNLLGVLSPRSGFAPLCTGLLQEHPLVWCCV